MVATVCLLFSFFLFLFALPAFVYFIPLFVAIYLTLYRPNDLIFSIESANSPLPVRKGDVVTFAYVRTARQAIPSSIVRIRKDVTWRDVVRNWHENVPLSERKGTFRQSHNHIFLLLYALKLDKITFLPITN